MVEAAERDGRLQPGGLLVEATFRNTGIALAMVATLRGYRLLLVVFDKTSDEENRPAARHGAEVVVTRSDVQAGHPGYYRDMAARLAGELPGRCW